MQIVDYYARPATALFGGVNSSRFELVSALQSHSKFDVMVIDAIGGYQSVRIPGIRYQALDHLFERHALMIPIGITKYLKKSNFVILHEGWNLGNLFVALICRTIKVPYFVIPHGVYDPKIVSGLRFKKIRSIFESSLLRGASFVNVFFESEQTHIHTIARSANTVVAPNGASNLWTRYKWVGGGDYVYFAGRLDVNHKGLDILLRAWSEIETPITLILQGQDFFEGVAKLENLILELNLSDKVLLLPHASHEEIMLKVEKCVFFAHISRWEAFGRSVVDAVSIGTPCLISTAMNIASTPGAAGVMEIVPLEHSKVVEGIRKLLTQDRSEINSTTKIDWVKSTFNWEKTVETLKSKMQ